MNNNLKNVLKYFKENIFFYIACIVIIVIFNVKLPYLVYSPGGLLDVRDRLSGDMYKQEGSFNLTYVTSRYGTIPNLLTALVLPSWDIISNDDVLPDNESLKELSIRNVILLKQSISSATNIAYSTAGKSITVTNEDDYVSYIFEEANTTLKVGDKLLEVDGTDIHKATDFKEFVDSKEIGDTLNIVVLRDGKKVKATAEVKLIQDLKLVGIQISKLYDYETDPKIVYETKKNEEGPSGGLMLTLSIYNGLVKEDITKGKVISGTGTIESDGTVGEISGVKYKLAGAVKNGADIFLAPSNNYKEAIELKKKNKYDIQIIEAKDFSQVLEELSKIKE